MLGPHKMLGQSMKYISYFAINTLSSPPSAEEFSLHHPSKPRRYSIFSHSQYPNQSVVSYANKSSENISQIVNERLSTRIVIDRDEP